jgi:hypothetical protein
MKNNSVNIFHREVVCIYDGVKLVAGQTSITLLRVEGHIGYGRPNTNVQIFTGGMKVDLEKAGIQLC